MTYRWLAVETVLALHERSIFRYGGSSGLRDRALLESAIGRSQNLFHYGGDVGVAELAATYLAGIVRNHPFVDGNKRAGLAAMGAFLKVNGHSVSSEWPEIFALVLSLAAGEIDDQTVSAWIRARLVRT